MFHIQARRFNFKPSSIGKPRIPTCSFSPLGVTLPACRVTAGCLVSLLFRRHSRPNAALEKFRHRSAFLTSLWVAIRSTLGLASQTCLPPPACMSALGSQTALAWRSVGAANA